MPRNVFSICMIIAMLLSLCSCVHAEIDTTVYPDGSGTAVIQTGYQSALSPFDASDIGLENAQYFTYNGAQYIGIVKPFSFSTLGELCAVFDGNMTITKTGSNAFIMVLNYDKRETLNTIMEQYPESCTEEELQRLESNLSLVYTFHFPYSVKMVGPPHDGVFINGNTLKIVLSDLSADSHGSLTFSIRDGSAAFTDVSPTAWYYAAVNAMTASGFVNGYADGTFRPSQTLSLAELCQVVARTSGLPTGPDERGYWAGQAIQSCLDAGYIAPHASYREPATREEAVGAIARAYRDLFEHDVSASNVAIPDYKDISIAYLSDIVFAYELGLCRGQDAKGTFHPKASLKRAELCQLYYNAGLCVN